MHTGHTHPGASGAPGEGCGASSPCSRVLVALGSSPPPLLLVHGYPEEPVSSSRAVDQSLNALRELPHGEAQRAWPD